MIQPLNSYKSGKPGMRPAIKDPRTLNLENYLKVGVLSPVPPAYDWTLKKKTDWGMMQNLDLCDCTCAAAGHMIECWTVNASHENVIDDTSVLFAYSAVSGYDAATGKNDNGACLLDVLKYWKSTGVGNHKIGAYATIDHKHHALVRAAIYMFGGIYVGLRLPNTVKGMSSWELVPGPLTGDSAPDSFGGHAVTVLAFDQTGLTCISWGAEIKITWAFWDVYCDQVFAVLTRDFLKNNRTPLGMNVSALESDLLSLTGEKKHFEAELPTIHQSKPVNSMNHEEKEGSANKGAGAKGNEAGRVSSAKGNEAGRVSSAKGEEAEAPAHHEDGNSGGHSGVKGNEAGRVSS